MFVCLFPPPLHTISIIPAKIYAWAPCQQTNVRLTVVEVVSVLDVQKGKQEKKRIVFWKSQKTSLDKRLFVIPDRQPLDRKFSLLPFHRRVCVCVCKAKWECVSPCFWFCFQWSHESFTCIFWLWVVEAENRGTHLIRLVLDFTLQFGERTNELSLIFLIKHKSMLPNLFNIIVTHYFKAD